MRGGVLRKAVAFGIFAAMSVALTTFIYAQIAHVSIGTERYSLVATFDDATNLQNGDPVRLAGVPVGQVSSVGVVAGRAEVRFSVDESVELGDDSEVAVRWLNLIGQRELYLYPGTSSRILTDGNEVERTRSVVDLGELVNQLGPLAGSISPQEVNALVDALVAAFEGNRTPINSIIDDLSAVAGTLAARDDTISQILDDYATLTGAVARRDRQLAAMVDNLAALSTAFAQSDDVLVDALEQLPQMTAGLQTLLSENADEVGRIIDGLSEVTDTVRSRLDSLDRIFAQLPAGLRAVFEAVSRGHYILVNNICLAPQAPPCPHPVLITTQAAGFGPLDSTDAMSGLLLGVER